MPAKISLTIAPIHLKIESRMDKGYKPQHPVHKFFSAQILWIERSEHATTWSFPMKSSAIAIPI
jgi:hypothetical protein